VNGRFGPAARLALACAVAGVPIRVAIAMPAADAGGQTGWYAFLHFTQGVEFVALVIGLQAIAIGLLFWQLARRRRAEHALRESEVRLERAVEGSFLAIWDWDIERDKTTWTGHLPAHLTPGPDPETGKGSLWEVSLHPQDAAGVRGALKDHLERGTAYDVDYRLKMRDGSYRWFRSRGQAHRDAGGKPVRMYGTLTDITDRKAAQHELRERERFIELVAEAAPTLLYVYDLRLDRVVFANGRTLTMLGISGAEMRTLGDRFLATVMHPDDFAAYPTHLQKLLRAADGEVVRLDYRVRASGGYRWLSGREMVLARDTDGSVRQIVGVAVDITEQRAAEDALRTSQERYELAVRGSFDGIWDWDVRSARVYYSARFKELLGYDEAEFPDVLDSWESRVHPDDRTGVVSGLGEHLRERRPFDREFRMRTRSGEYRWFRARGQAVWNSAGVATRMAGSLTDITDRRAAEQAVRASEQRLSALVGRAPVGIIVWTSEFTVAGWNPAAEEIFGYTQSQAVGMPAWRIVPGAAREQVGQIWSALLSATGGMNSTNKNIRSDGREIMVSWYNAPLVNDAGVVTGVVSVCADITESLAAQEALRASEERYRLLFDRNPCPMWVYDIESLRFLDVNEAAIAHYGYSREEFLAMTIGDIRPAGDLERLAEQVAAPGGDVRPAGVWRHVQKNGQVIEVEVTSYSIDFDGRSARLVLAIDVTERRAAERKLRESEERYRLVMRATFEAVYDWNMRDNVLTWGENAERLFRLPEGGLGREITGWESRIHPDDRDAVMASLNAAVKGDAVNWWCKYRFKRGDGSWAMMSDRAWLDRDGSGGLRRMIGAMQDITELHLAEEALRASEAKLREAQRIARLGNWELSVRTGRVRWSEEVFGLFERDPALREPSFEESLSYYASESRERLRAAVERGIARGEGSEHDLEVRLAQGRTVWHHAVIRPVTGRGGAIEKLAGTVQDITERKAAEDALRASEARTSAVLDAMPDLMFRIDRRGTYLSYHAPNEADLMAPPTQFLGRTARQVMATKLAEQCMESLERCLRSGEVVTYEYEITGPTGRTRAWEVRMAPCAADEVVALVRDVTERKTAERRQSLMLAELDHRVKNNLAAVLSIAEQTIRSCETMSDFSETFTGRLRAMARMHAALARTKWEGARLADLIRPAVEAYVATRGPTLETRGEDVVLPARAALPVAMALHELATNAAKYGAFSTEGGHVSLTWETTASETGERVLHVVWQESGGPPVRNPDRRGFGSELIKGGIAYELRGNVELHFDEAGVRCDMNIPLVDDPVTTRLEVGNP
jgi:PAS domain S-box-containing protein